MALGDGRGTVLRRVRREGLVVRAVGLEVGQLGTARILDSLFYEVSALDPGVFVLALLLLEGVFLAATYWPARRAT